MGDFLFPVEYAKENILIDNKEYPFIIFLSADDGFNLIGSIKHTPDSCRRAVAEYIRTRLDISEDQKPSIDRIVAQDNNFFAHLFGLICGDDENLKKLYDARIDDTDVCHRFVSALKAELADIPYKQLASVVPIPKVQIPQIPTGALEACKVFAHQWTAISEVAATAHINTTQMLTEFAQRSDDWYSNIQHSFDIINQLGNTLSTFLQSVYIPELSNERKEQLRIAHETWGKLGWTQPPFAPDTFLDKPPVDRKDANARALRYCQNADMEQLFSALLDLPHVKKSDVNEAKWAFKNKQYKSCALILFALIDSRLIRLQRNEDRRKKDKYREVGKGAAKKLFERIEKEQDIHKKTFMLFSHQNIIQCLLTVFADGKDFRVQPDIINRNFVDHGMLIRRVIRQDCIQLFLLYYNLLDYLDIIYGKH